MRAGGGIGDELDAPYGDPLEYWRMIFDYSFFLFVIIILLAIIQGNRAPFAIVCLGQLDCLPPSQEFKNLEFQFISFFLHHVNLGGVRGSKASYLGPKTSEVEDPDMSVGLGSLGQRVGGHRFVFVFPRHPLTQPMNHSKSIQPSPHCFPRNYGQIKKRISKNVFHVFCFV